MSVRFTTARTTSYIAYLRPIITGRMSRVSRFPSRVFRSRGTYHGRNHNNEWPQFSRYKPRDGTASLLAFRIKPVKRNTEARVYLTRYLGRLTASRDKNARYLTLHRKQLEKDKPRLVY